MRRAKRSNPQWRMLAHIARIIPSRRVNQVSRRVFMGRPPFPARPPVWTCLVGPSRIPPESPPMAAPAFSYISRETVAAPSCGGGGTGTVYARMTRLTREQAAAKEALAPAPSADAKKAAGSPFVGVCDG